MLGAAASNSSGVSRHALTAKAPDLLAVTAATDALFTHFPLPQGSSRGLTRVHLHSLGLHIIAQRSLPAATGKHPRAPARWAHAEAAVAKGALAATFQVRRAPALPPTLPPTLPPALPPALPPPVLTAPRARPAP